MTSLAVYVGWDPREVDAYNVCVHSIRKNSSIDLDVRALKLADLRKDGLYDRETETRDGRLWDAISEAPMATEFAITRFFAPLLADRDSIESDWVLFCDCDFLWTGDVAELVAELDPTKAVMCVKHNHAPVESTKMDGQLQLLYARKNWSSMMVFNRNHPSNKKLTVELLNSVPGRDLHRFCWLEDDEIGGVSKDWNWLEGHSPKTGDVPRVIHYTRGGPWMEGWEDVDYGDLWLRALEETRSTV
ncbi:hypothetical protein [Sagittula salina]|uniref:Glycosyltransferase n=1 Tax=Sagittula salina TaxID=2820268 RepID=A0A940MW68_9RHOB|nr:hypothetical protein [Sagittula salina]MBP0485052.1 hypothetical protein [Sagittula salina]